MLSSLTPLFCCRWFFRFSVVAIGSSVFGSVAGSSDGAGVVGSTFGVVDAGSLFGSAAGLSTSVL